MGFIRDEFEKENNQRLSDLYEKYIIYMGESEYEAKVILDTEIERQKNILISELFSKIIGYYPELFI